MPSDQHERSDPTQSYARGGETGNRRSARAVHITRVYSLPPMTCPNTAYSEADVGQDLRIPTGRFWICNASRPFTDYLLAGMAPHQRRPTVLRRLALPLGACLALAGCGNDAPAQPAPPPAPVTAGVPGITLPADMPPLACADFEPPPVAKPAEKFAVRRCADPDGSIRWIAGFFQCADGRIWPVLSKDQPTGAPSEPTGPDFDRCVGR